jgi:hypothetical protein
MKRKNPIRLSELLFEFSVSVNINFMRVTTPSINSVYFISVMQNGLDIETA